MIAFSGILVAFTKLQGVIPKTITLLFHNVRMAVLGLIILGLYRGNSFLFIQKIILYWLFISVCYFCTASL